MTDLNRLYDWGGIGTSDATGLVAYIGMAGPNHHPLPRRIITRYRKVRNETRRCLTAAWQILRHGQEDDL